MSKKDVLPAWREDNDLIEDKWATAIELEFGAVSYELAVAADQFGEALHTHARHSSLRIQKKDGTIREIDASYRKRGTVTDELCVLRRFANIAFNACKPKNGSVLVSLDDPDTGYVFQKNVKKRKGKKNLVTYSLVPVS